MKRIVLVPVLFGLLWTALLASLFLWDLAGERRHVQDLARSQVKALFQLITVTRSWNTLHGGVYVLRSPEAEPNPHLPAEERTLLTDSGQVLVKVNPAFMTRGLSTIATDREGVRFHITSLNPIRPENAPDTWERESLALCAPGQERLELTPIGDGGSWFRYMAPLTVEPGCLSCHREEAAGSVRGGISVSIPAGPLLDFQEANLNKQAKIYGVIWLVGLLGLSGFSLELSRRRAKAERLSQVKSRFLANMSHDMRTPLTGILGLAERLKAREEGQRARYSGLIRHSAQALLEMVNDILDFARLDSGRLELTPRPFDLRRTVARVADIFGFPAEEKGLEFSVAVDDEAPSALVGDEFRFRQVLSNLVGNAVKFTEQGSVRVLVSAGDAGQGRVAVRCEVRDTGVGIAPQDVESIFDSFSQADDSLARRHAGSGLGLSIARQLARLMGGDVTVRSTPGEGSRFLFTAAFERCEGACAARAGAEDSPQPELAGLLAGRRVLVVDDHGVNRVLLADILAECGAEASLAASGREALALFARGRFDLVLMDLQMPEMGGVETAARLRRMEDRAGSGRTPMLVLTAFASPEDAGVTLGEDFDGLVTKPIDISVLLDALRRVLRDRPRALSEVQARRDSALDQPDPAQASLRPEAPESALLDPGPALKLLGGRRELLRILTREFAETAGDLADALAQALDSGNRREAERAAHTLKTGAATVGAPRLRDLAARAEARIRDGETPGEADLEILRQVLG